MSEVIEAFASYEDLAIIEGVCEKCIPYPELFVAKVMIKRDKIDTVNNLGGIYIHVSNTPVYGRIIRALHTHAEAGQSPIVLSISLCPDPYPYFSFDPINVATMHAACDFQIVSVIATGNFGPEPGAINPWALAPWVIGIGAADAEGKDLLEKSGRGVEGDLNSFPDVVADGNCEIWLRPQDPEPHGTMVGLLRIGKGETEYDGLEKKSFSGTSVAVPRVARICDLLQNLFLHVLAFGMHLSDLAGTELQGSQGEVSSVVVLESLERLASNWSDDDALTPRPEYGLISELPVRYFRGVMAMYIQLALAGLAPNQFRSAVVAANQEPYMTNILSGMLKDMAIPMKGYGPHEVGAGFVSDAIAESYLAELTVEHFMGVTLGDPGVDMNPHLASTLIFPKDFIQHVRSHFDETSGIDISQVV